MAEPEHQEQGNHPEGRSKTWGKVRNWWITWLKHRGIYEAIEDATGQAPEYRRYQDQPLERFQPVRAISHFIGLLVNRNRDVIEKERQWDEIEKVRESIEHLYAGARIYLNPLTTEYEYSIYQNGVEGDLDYTHIEFGDKIYACPMPPKTRIRYEIPGYRRGWIVEISPFGYNKRGDYIKLYKELINEICKDARIRLLSQETDPAIIKNIDTNINAVNSQFQTTIANLLGSYCGSDRQESTEGLPSVGIENRYYSFLGQCKINTSALEGTALQINNISLRQEKFRRYTMYFNTFKVIKPILYGEGENNAKIMDRLDNPDYKWDLKDGEFKAGCDEYGYPLEVETDKKVMMDHYDANGKYSNDTGRPVPEKFIKPLDPLERVNYETVYFDTIRDDLRDGRFHPNSLTITDYLQANNPSLFELWRKREEGDHGLMSETAESNGKTVVHGQNIFDVKLNEWDKPIRKYKVSPSDKNPAFDLRNQSVDWKHIGRKYYYMFPDHSFGLMSQNKEGHITSRGVSMYIIEHLTREIEEINDMKDALKYIEDRPGCTGFDYGPRPWSPGDKGWAESMNKNILEWDDKMEAINKPAPKADLNAFKERLDSEYGTNK